MDQATHAIIERILLTVVPLASVVTVGFIYALRHRPDMDAVNRINIDVFVPALVFSVLSARSFELSQYALLALACLLLVLGSGLLLLPLCRALRVSPRTLLPPMMFRNSGNLGLPVAVLALGEQALPAAVMLFLCTNVLHFSLGIYLLDHRSHPLELLKMPMILASIAGLIWSTLGIPLPEALQTTVEMLGRVSIPLMLFALGARMISIDFGTWRIGLAGALLCPLVGAMLALAIARLLPLQEDQVRSLLLYSVLPPAVMNFMLAERFRQAPAQVAAVVLMGNCASLLIIPAALFFVLR